MKPNLFVGMSGFLGTNLKNKMIENGILGDSVQLYGRKDCDLLDFNTTLNKFEEVGAKTVVLMQGAVGGITLNIDRPASLMERNLLMGLNCIRAAKLTNVERIILIGTVCSYPREPSQPVVPFKEEMLHSSQPDWSNRPYGTAKLCLMEYLNALKREHGIMHTTLMLANMYGKYDDFSDNSSHVVPALIKRFTNNKHDKELTCFGTGEATRDLLYVEDACDAILRCVESEDYGDTPEVMNIGTGEETSISKLAYMIRDMVGGKFEIKWDTTKSDGQPRRVLDCSLAKEWLGWESETSLREGLASTINWYKNHGA